MKSTKDIISHIRKDPLFASMSDRVEFMRLLPINWRRIIAFIYVREGDLMIALKHPLGLQELKRDSNIKFIKELLSLFVRSYPECEFSAVKEIKFFVADKFAKRLRKANGALNLSNFAAPIAARSLERSRGKFKNVVKDPQIYRAFEEIRGLILANRGD